MVDFKIEITKDCVSVSTSSGGWPPKPKTVGLSLLYFVWAAAFIYPVSPVVRDWSDPFSWILMLIVPLVIGRILWYGFRDLFPSGESLICDHNTLTIGIIPRSSLQGRWVYESFPINTVRDLGFGGVERSRYGVTMGLRFKVDGKRKKTLAGLESPEAAKILDALASLGIHIVRDPGMPMMVEMALSRRKHFGGLL